MENTISILALMLVILFYISSKKNKANRWCAFSGFLFAFGAFKESYVKHLAPWLYNRFPNAVSTYQLFIGYSIMEWICAAIVPASLTYAILILCDMDKQHPIFLNIFICFLLVTIISLSITYPPWAFDDEHVFTRKFWVTFGTYNFVLILFATIVFLHNIVKECAFAVRAQKRLVAMVTLPPIWSALLLTYSPYIINPVGKKNIWQLVIITIAICLGFYIYMAFKNGIMGLRLRYENYEWDSELLLSNKGAQYLQHQIKNQATKVEFCIDNLTRSHEGDGTPEEYGIIMRAMDTMRAGIDRFIEQSGQIELSEDIVILEKLIRIAFTLKSYGTDLSLDIGANCCVTLYCDRHHILEVLTNIAQNAAEGIKQLHSHGNIEVTGYFDYRHKNFDLMITDDGVGIKQEDLKHIFQPYFTTKLTGNNYGLGLTYCKNVMKKHGGDIFIDHAPKGGTLVILRFPIRRVNLLPKESYTKKSGAKWIQ